MLLSTFELLLKKITPNAGNISGSDRKVLQGYFLNISNPTTKRSRIRLIFHATTPSLDPSKLLEVLDTGGTNNFNGSLVADGTDRYRYDFSLDAQDTGLFILQPDITKLDPNTQELEVRGFVEIIILRSSKFLIPKTQPLLVTPEHRGTFLPSPNNNQNDFDQLNVAIPTSTGASLIDVDVEYFFSKFPTSIDDLNGINLPLQPLDDANSSGQPEVSLFQALNTMAQRIETIEEYLVSDQS